MTEDYKPDPQIYVQLIQECENLGKEGGFSPRFTELQRAFLKERPAKPKSLIRLGKPWYLMVWPAPSGQSRGGGGEGDSEGEREEEGRKQKAGGRRTEGGKGREEGRGQKQEGKDERKKVGGRGCREGERSGSKKVRPGTVPADISFFLVSPYHERRAPSFQLCWAEPWVFLIFFTHTHPHTRPSNQSASGFVLYLKYTHYHQLLQSRSLPLTPIPSPTPSVILGDSRDLPSTSLNPCLCPLTTTPRLFSPLH